MPMLLLKKISYFIWLIFLLSFISFLPIYFYHESNNGFFVRYLHFMLACLHEIQLLSEPESNSLLILFFLPTIKLFLSVGFFMILIGFPLGIFIGLIQNKMMYSLFHLFFVLCYSVPILFLGLFVFLQLLPQYRYYLVSLDKYYQINDMLDYFNVTQERIEHNLLYSYFLPVCILSLQPCAVTIHVVSKHVQQILNRHFIKFERAQNNTYYSLIIRHLIPNIAPKTVYQLLNYMTIIFFFTISIELIFNLKGLGQLVYHAFLLKEANTIAMTILFSGIFMSLCLLVSQIVIWILFPAERRKLP